MVEPDLRELLGTHASRHSVPGAAVAVLHDGTATAAYSGIADVASGEPVTTETRFAIGSLTKPMVATAIARLAADGCLSVDHPIAEYVPELLGVTWARRATIRDLLANRSGLPLSAALEFAYEGEDDGVLSRLASALATETPSPVAWSYSNAGWCLLGRAMETATGLLWEEAMRSILLRPLNMEMTTFASSRAGDPRAVGHDVAGHGLVTVAPWMPRAYGPSGTQLLSTLTDLVRFAQAHLEDPGLAQLRETHADVQIHGWLDAWCLGWARFDWECDTWGWDGVLSGQRAILRLLPDLRGAIALLTNGRRGRAMYRSLFPELVDRFFGVTMPSLQLRPSPGAAGDLERFVGTYAWPDRRTRVSVAGDVLVLERAGRRTEVPPIDERTFLVDADEPDTPTVTFGAFDVDGRPGVLYEMLWGLPRA